MYKYDRDGSSPLFHAAFNGYTRLCEILLKAGADINLTNKHICTAVVYAGNADHQTTIYFLLENGADLTIQNSNQKTPLDLALETGKTKVSKLIEEYLQTILTSADKV